MYITSRIEDNKLYFDISRNNKVIITSELDYKKAFKLVKDYLDSNKTFIDLPYGENNTVNIYKERYTTCLIINNNGYTIDNENIFVEIISNTLNYLFGVYIGEEKYENETLVEIDRNRENSVYFITLSLPGDSEDEIFYHTFILEFNSSGIKINKIETNDIFIVSNNNLENNDDIKVGSIIHVNNNGLSTKNFPTLLAKYGSIYSTEIFDIYIKIIERFYSKYYYDINITY